MKKILVFSLIIGLMTVTASAQTVRGGGLRRNQLTRMEKMELRKDLLRNRVLTKKARRDGIITPLERRRIHRSKCDTRRDLIRFKHNGRRRLI